MGIPRDLGTFWPEPLKWDTRDHWQYLNEEVTNMLQQNFAGDLHSLVKERAAI